jgi:hypothetical protein
MGRWLVALVCVSAGCNGAEDQGSDCRVEERASAKEHFVGDGQVLPRFTATFTLLDAAFSTSTNQPVLSTEPQSYRDVEFEIAEDLIVARGSGGTPLAGFRIASHREDDCKQPYCFEVECARDDPSSLWHDRGWFVVEWSRNEVGDGHRFDAATAAGYPDAVAYEPLSYFDEGSQVKFDEHGGSIPRLKVFIVWTELQDGTPGCAFDVPDFDASADCPVGEITYRLDFER